MALFASPASPSAFSARRRFFPDPGSPNLIGSPDGAPPARPVTPESPDSPRPKYHSLITPAANTPLGPAP